MTLEQRIRALEDAEDPNAWNRHEAARLLRGVIDSGAAPPSSRLRRVVWLSCGALLHGLTPAGLRGREPAACSVEELLAALHAGAEARDASYSYFTATEPDPSIPPAWRALFELVDALGVEFRTPRVPSADDDAPVDWGFA